jgi:hypothetical protein
MPILNGYEALSCDTTFPAYTQRTEVASGTATYYGWAQVGHSDTSGSAWRIARLETSGSATALKFADGNANFDNVWGQRATKTYS